MKIYYEDDANIEIIQEHECNYCWLWFTRDMLMQITYMNQELM